MRLSDHIKAVEARVLKGLGHYGIDFVQRAKWGCPCSDKPDTLEVDARPIGPDPDFNLTIFRTRVRVQMTCRKVDLVDDWIDLKAGLSCRIRKCFEEVKILEAYLTENNCGDVYVIFFEFQHSSDFEYVRSNSNT